MGVLVSKFVLFADFLEYLGHNCLCQLQICVQRGVDVIHLCRFLDLFR